MRGIGQTTQGFDINLERPRRSNRRLCQHAGGDLDILRPQGGDHVAGGKIVRSDLSWVEPDAHGVIPRAERLDVADTVEPGDRIFDVQGGVVGQVELVARAIRREEMGHDEIVARHLLDRETELLHRLR